MIRRQQQLTQSTWRQQQPKSGGISQNIERGCVHASRRSIIRYELLELLYMKTDVYVCWRLHIVVCKGCSFYFHREVWWLDFMWKHFSLQWLFFVGNKVLYFCTLQTMHLPLGLPSHLFSLAIPKERNNNKETTGTSHKTFSEWKQVHVGMELSKTKQTRWEWHHNICACFHSENVFVNFYYAAESESEPKLLYNCRYRQIWMLRLLSFSNNSMREMLKSTDCNNNWEYKGQNHHAE